MIVWSLNNGSVYAGCNSAAYGMLARLAQIVDLYFYCHLQRIHETMVRNILTTRCRRLAVLGSGGFGKVYKARHRLDGAEYAIKKIVLTASHLRYLLKEKKLDRVPREIKTLARLDHHHITRYHHCWIESTPYPLPREDEDNSK